MAYLTPNKMVTILFTTLLVFSTVMVFVLVQNMSALNPDPRDQPHDYSFEGTLGAETCNGKGTSEYSEGNVNMRTYTISLTVSSQNSSKNLTFGVLFDKNDHLDSAIYTNTGKQRIDEEEVDVWTYSDAGIDYTLYAGKDCTLKRICMSSSEFNLVGVLQDC